MSTREQVTLLRSLEELGVIVICANDNEIEEAVDYEMGDGRDGDNETYT